MKKTSRITIFSITIILLSILLSGITYYVFSHGVPLKKQIITLLLWIFSLLLINDTFIWVKRGKRGDSFDIIILIFLFLVVYLFTDDAMNSLIGAFSIYLIFGIMELKDYEVLNKLLIITVVTYNFIFFAGLLNSYMKIFGHIDTDVIRDTAFSLSIWIMLILGFALFGRRYIVVFRFLSPNYLTMLLFIIAWLLIKFVARWFEAANDFIYLALILTNFILYLSSGPILDFTLGIKKTDNEELQKMVSEVQKQIGLEGNIRVGFGKYPILNAFAYGSIWDKRIAIIAPEIDSIPKDELRGIIAHELNHVKGKHTLILALISTIELIIFWILKWPATYYDFVFNPDDQPFTMGVFILMNIIISIFLYIFVRILEAKADQNCKKDEIGGFLAKGLYNLEGFYASGREIGLDTMLLVDEEINEYNKINNYASTAEYLFNNMYQPSRLTLLSNLMNSHPSSFHRIPSIYQDINPWKEAMLPFTLMSSRKRRNFALQYNDSRLKFKEMANLKFKEMFGIDNYANYLQKLNKMELYETLLNKTYFYVDKKNLKIGIGKIIDVEFQNDICESVHLIMSQINISDLNIVLTKYNLNLDQKSNFDKHIQEITLNDDQIEEIITNTQELFVSKNMNDNNHDNKNIIRLNLLYTKIIEFDIGSIYEDKKDSFNRLLTVIIPELDFDQKLNDLMKNSTNEKDKKIDKKVLNDYNKVFKGFVKTVKHDAKFIYIDGEGKISAKSITGKKIAFNVSLIEKNINKNVFYEDKGTLKILKFSDYQKNENLLENEIVCSNELYPESPSDEKFISIKLGDTIIKMNEFSFIFHNDKSTEIYERELLNHLKNEGLRATIYLKKAVNNQETGYIQNVIMDDDIKKENRSIKIKNIQGELIDIPLKKLEVIVFAEETLIFRDKNKMSFGEKIIERIGHWRKPSKSFNQ